MREADDKKRRKLVWFLPNGSPEYFFLDYYSYRCVQNNIKKANYALKTNNIDYSYSRQGWISLLSYYASTLLNMYWDKLSYLVDVVKQSTITECEYLECLHSYIKDRQARYNLDWSNKRILTEFINIATTVQYAMKNTYKIYAYPKEQHGYYKQECYKTTEDTLEEDSYY